MKMGVDGLFLFLFFWIPNSWFRKRKLYEEGGQSRYHYYPPAYLANKKQAINQRNFLSACLFTAITRQISGASYTTLVGIMPKVFPGTHIVICQIMLSLALPFSNRLITHVRAMINTHCFARVRYTNPPAPPLTKFAMAAHVSAKQFQAPFPS